MANGFSQPAQTTQPRSGHYHKINFEIIETFPRNLMLHSISSWIKESFGSYLGFLIVFLLLIIPFALFLAHVLPIFLILEICGRVRNRTHQVILVAEVMEVDFSVI